mgnify:CR=1 FL=1
MSLDVAGFFAPWAIHGVVLLLHLVLPAHKFLAQFPRREARLRHPGIEEDVNALGEGRDREQWIDAERTRDRGTVDHVQAVVHGAWRRIAGGRGPGGAACGRPGCKRSSRLLRCVHRAQFSDAAQAAEVAIRAAVAPRRLSGPAGSAAGPRGRLS